MKTIETHLEALKGKELLFVHAHKITFEGNSGTYAVLGNIPYDLGILKITIQFQPKATAKRHTAKVDLYDTHQITKLSVFLLEKDMIHSQTAFEADLIKISELIQDFREKLFEKEEETEKLPTLDVKTEKEVVQFLRGKSLLKNIDKQLVSLGIVGEANNRLLTFLIAISYKTAYPLHGIIQSSSGAGKSHLINTIGECIPTTDIISLTRITSKSLYHYKDGDLTNKLVLIQDFSGLDEESQYAFRELQSAGKISTSTTRKDKWGEIKSSVKTVHGHFSSLSATTKEIYTDNLSRSILIKVDESQEQTKKIVTHQNAVLAGKVDTKDREIAKHLLTNMIRVLQTESVTNPFADKLQLPMEAKQQRRLNQQFQYFILLVTWLHQHQRERQNNNLISTKEDVLMAIDMLFDSIMLKIDDLDTTTRYFFEKLKEYIKTKKTKNSATYKFSQKEVRDALHVSKSHTGKNLKTLLELEYIAIVSGTINKGFSYQVTCWDDNEKTRKGIKTKLIKQVEALEELAVSGDLSQKETLDAKTLKKKPSSDS